MPSYPSTVTTFHDRIEALLQDSTERDNLTRPSNNKSAKRSQAQSTLLESDLVRSYDDQVIINDKPVTVA